MKATSYIELNSKAYENNIQFIRELIGNQCVLSSVVKGNAYGHGIETFVPMAEKAGISHFSVFSAHEAYRLAQVSTGKSTLLIMGVVDHTEELEWAIQNGVEFFVYDTSRLQQAISIAKQLQKKAKIHIELETGLNRTGFSTNELPEVIHLVKNNMHYLELAGLCSHFAGAESIANYFRVKNQIINFTKQKKHLHQQELNFSHYHLACSAAIINYPSTIYNLVRIGIMQYGFWSNRETQMKYYTKNETNTNPLQPVISWKSYVMGVKDVKSGEFISYGNSVLAETDMKIATIPVGYSHGFSRSLSNQGKVLIRGNRLDVVGLVNMNMMIIDITNSPDISKGDEVVLIGTQEDKSISVDSFGDLSSQLNYELLTRLPEEIPRKIKSHF
jgi:alanine racemase